MAQRCKEAVRIGCVGLIELLLCSTLRENASKTR